MATAADRGRLPAVQRGPIRFVDAEEEVELTLADGEPVGRVHRGLLGKEDIHRTIGVPLQIRAVVDAVTANGVVDQEIVFPVGCHRPETLFQRRREGIKMQRIGLFARQGIAPSPASATKAR